MKVHSDDTSPLDIATLELIGQRTERHPLVDQWELQPDELAPRKLSIRFDPDQYPSVVTDVRIDVRWYENGDYSFQYLESHARESWQCRWDRHPKPDEPREHFHPPPTASSVEPSPLTETHPLAVVFWILDWVGERLSNLHV